MPNMGFRGIYAGANSAFGGRIVGGDILPSIRGNSFPSIDLNYLNSLDTYFKNNTLLLKAVGANTQQNYTFLDSSPSNLTVTRNGDVNQGTFSPYGFQDGAWSAHFDGAGDYISIAANAAFSFPGDFTVEFWAFPLTNSNSAPSYIIMLLPGTTYFAINFQAGSYISAYLNLGTPSINATDVYPIQNSWNHIALVRSGFTVKVYVNGVASSTTATNSSTLGSSTETFFIGNGSVPACYMSNVRVVKGAAVYTSNFTPPSSPLTAISGTTLLACQNNRFKDNSTNNFTVTPLGNAKVSAFSPFNPTSVYSAAINGGSAYFDGAGDSLIGSSPLFTSTSQSTFTIEGWVYPTTFATLISIVGDMVTTSGDTKTIAAEVNTSGQVALYWFDGAIKRCTGNSVMQLNAWNYFAIVVNVNAISIYVNKTTADTLTGTTTLTNRTQSTNLGIGAYYNNNTPAQYFNGYLCDIRVSNNAKSITSIPTAPLTSDVNTRLLLNATNAGIVDASRKNNLYTVGDTKVATNIFKYNKSIYFDGAGDYLTAPSSAIQSLGSGDFTIELWCYQPNINAGTRIISALTPYATGNSGYAFYLSAGYAAWFVGGSNRIVSTNPVSASTWTHIAIVRSSGTTKMYFDGVQTGSSYTDSTNYSGTFYIGSDTTQHYIGYMEDFRITVGYARYTTNFTPPSVLIG